MAKFSLMQKKLNLEQTEGKYSAFAKCCYALPVRLSKPLAENGYGRVCVDGIEISRGKAFFMDSIIKMHCMLIPVGEVAREFDREYTVSFSGFTAADGSKFRNQSFKFRTMPRKQRDERYIVHDENRPAGRPRGHGAVEERRTGASIEAGCHSQLPWHCTVHFPQHRHRRGAHQPPLASGFSSGCAGAQRLPCQ